MRTYKSIAGLFLIAWLTGCTGSPSFRAYNDLHIDDTLDVSGDTLLLKEEEEAAWRKIEKLSPVECSAGPSPPDREKAVEISNCISRLVERHVLPRSAFPDIIRPSRAEALRIAKDYAAGKLSPLEYRKRSEERVKKYQDTWASRAFTRHALNTVEQNWQGDT